MRTWILSILAVLLLVIVGLSLFLAYDPAFFRTLILTEVEAQFGRRIEVGDARLELLPRIRLELTRVVVREPGASETFFTAERIDLTLKAFALLRQQVIAKRLIVEQPKLHLHRDAQGQWNFLAPGTAQPGSEMSNPLAMLLMVRDSTLTQGDVDITDAFRPDGIRTLHITGLDASVAVDRSGRTADVRVSGLVTGSSGPTSISMSGNIVHSDSRIRLDAENLTATGPDIRFDGQAEALHVDLRQLADFLGPRPLPERLHGTANLHSAISLVPGVVGYDLLLSRMKAEVEGLGVTGQASLSGIMAPQATFSVTFASSAVTLDNLMKRLPVQWLHHDIESIIQEREVTGTVEVVTATLTGTAAPQPRVSFTGEFKVSQGHVVVGRDRTPIQNLAATLFIEPDRLRVVDLTGSYGPMRVIGGKALVSLLESGPVLELNVAGELAAADLISVLAQKITYAPVAEQLGALREVKGDASVMLRITGPVKEPQNLELPRAEVTAHDVWFQTPLLTEKVVDMNGRFVFTPSAIEFHQLAGRMGRSQLELQGTIMTGAQPSYQDLTVRARADGKQLMQWLPKGKWSDLTLAGMVGFVGALSGPLKTPRLKGAAELRDAEVGLPGIFAKAVGTPASIEFEGARQDDHLLAVDRLDLVLPPFRLSGKGKLRRSGTGPPSFEAAIVSGPISLAGLPSEMSLGPAKDGILEVSLDIRGKGDDWRAWSIGGWVALTDGLVMTKTPDEPITDLYLRLKLVRNAAEIKRLAFKIRDSDMRISGTIRNWQRSPTANLALESSQMDLDLLIPKGVRSPVRDALETIADTSHVVVFVTVDRGYYRRFLFTDLSWRLQLRDGLLLADRITGDTDDGHLGGRLLIHLPKEKAADLEASLQLTGVPFQRVTSLFGRSEDVLSGRLSFSGTLQGREGHAQGILPTIHSVTPVEVTIEDGRIHQLTVVSKIFTILNLPTLLQGKVDLSREGMPFDRISALFRINEGVVTADRILVDSPVMKMSGAGQYNMVGDELDMVMATSPFGSYAQLLKSIPLFGKLFKGEREGLDTALFEVKGSLKDPRVTYLPIKSFAKGVTGLAQLAFDVLVNTITLPKEIMAPSEPEAAPPAPDGMGRRPIAATP